MDYDAKPTLDDPGHAVSQLLHHRLMGDLRDAVGMKQSWVHVEYPGVRYEEE